jgi:putative oxidoreductase
MNIPFLIGRSLLGGFFLYNGLNHLRPQSRTGLAQYAAAKNVPYPDVAVATSGVAMLVGGISVLSGYKPKLGAAALGGVLTAMTPTMHDFWNASDQNKQMELVQFSKNAALIGAAMVLLSIDEPWPASV